MTSRTPRTRRGPALLAVAIALATLLGASHATGAQEPVPDLDGATTTAPAPATTIDQSHTTTPALDTDDVPDYDDGPDLDMDRIVGPRVEDGKVTSTTFYPLGFAAIAILVIFGTIFYRAARGNRRPGRAATPSSATAPSDDETTPA